MKLITNKDIYKAMGFVETGCWQFPFEHPYITGMGLRGDEDPRKLVLRAYDLGFQRGGRDMQHHIQRSIGLTA
jgi:hypothetical protein